MTRYEAWKQAIERVAFGGMSGLVNAAVFAMIAIWAVLALREAQHVPERCFEYADAPHDYYVCMSEYASGAASYVSDEVKGYWYGN